VVGVHIFRRAEAVGLVRASVLHFVDAVFSSVL
jgi:hypothetical protein